MTVFRVCEVTKSSAQRSLVPWQSLPCIILQLLCQASNVVHAPTLSDCVSAPTATQTCQLKIWEAMEPSGRGAKAARRNTEGRKVTWYFFISRCVT